MVKLIKMSILINIIMLATGCASMMKNSISFAIKGQNKSYIYKNTWPECANFKINPALKYNDLSDSCKVPPEGYVPQQIIIEYAPWLTYEEQVRAGLGNVRSFFNLDELSRDKWPSDEILHAYADNIERKKMAAIDKLPPTAWKQIVLTPSKEVEKYKHQVPEGKGNRSRGKNIHYIISLNPDGSYSIETKLYWIQKYQKNWN
ncbi:hypothetical protein [Acinetobacter terrae]|nr:hypothetical protein [Acinetobacter terrae]